MVSEGAAKAFLKEKGLAGDDIEGIIFESANNEGKRREIWKK